MWLKWLPWRYLVRRAAKAHGFLDPLDVLSRLERFAQPSEVTAPLELVRAGVVFHARGLMNTAAIQHNLDWVWPFWAERQFDPRDDAFIPRAFSITHVNLTHRNWTAVGVPDCEWFPIVDPRGLVTPFWDGWSLDAWIVDDEGNWLIPCEAAFAKQTLEFDDTLAVVTECPGTEMTLRRRVEVVVEEQGLVCLDDVTATAEAGGWLVLSLRPTNPEGVSFLHSVELRDDLRGWRIEGAEHIEFDIPAQRHRLSTYRGGDVRVRIPEPGTERSVACDVGLATAAAMFRIEPGGKRRVVTRVSQWSGSDPVVEVPPHATASGLWQEALANCCHLEVPDGHYQFLYEAALRTLVLLSPLDAYPGPYTYKRFWYRDAVFMAHGMLCAGLVDRAERLIDRFPLRQDRTGYFHSQEGEWDSNGEVLWIMRRFCELTGRRIPEKWRQPIEQAARWIINKRLSDELDVPHAGLMPSGFSAEHLGPSDFYYWDDFWSLAGLRSAGAMMEDLGQSQQSATMRSEADRLEAAIESSLEMNAADRDRPGIPASPYRRMDSGAVGSLVAGYPLELWQANDPRLLDTVDFLLTHCFVHGGFFQDMIHSGVNAYLTLHVAQILLRAGNPRGTDLIEAVANLASPTGQWPEAIHPRTLGGCMGDGQHGWAAIEWIAAMRNSFVREEGDDRLILGAGLPSKWLEGDKPMAIRSAPTRFGSVDVEIEPQGDAITTRWSATWRTKPRILVRLNGSAAAEAAADDGVLIIARAAVL